MTVHNGGPEMIVTSKQLIGVRDLLATIQRTAVDCCALADDAEPGTARRGFATLAASVARAQHQVEFLIQLAGGNPRAN